MGGFLFSDRMLPRLEIVAMRRAFSKERLEAIKVEVSIEGDAARIETIYPPPPAGFAFCGSLRDGRLPDFRPARLARSSQVELANGEVLIEGMRGARIEAQLGTGLMHVRDCFSAAQLQLGRGQMNVRYGWWEAGAFSLGRRWRRAICAWPCRRARRCISMRSQAGQVMNHFAARAKRVPRLDEHFGGESAVEFKLRTTAGDIAARARLLNCSAIDQRNPSRARRSASAFSSWPSFM